LPAAEYFLKIDGVDGESADAKHKGEIKLESFSWEESNPGGGVSAGGGAGAGKVQVGDLRCAARTSKASPRLALACASGQHFPSAVLTVRRTAGTKLEFLRISLDEVVVSSYAVAGSTDPPTDEFALAFARIRVEYTPQAPSGKAGTPVQVGWDVVRAREI
jgi:type VI secretion system secreted protein Hcp